VICDKHIEVGINVDHFCGASAPAGSRTESAS
jgi:hypothetical protein